MTPALPRSPRDDLEPPLPAPPVPPAPPELRMLALEHTVRWEPLHDAVSSLAVPLGTISAVEPLVVHQHVLASVEAQAAVPGFAFGVLYGALYRCPRLHMNYALIEGVQPGSLDDVGPDAELRSALGAMISRLRGSGVRPIGWYRSGAATGVRISPAEIAMHAALFPEPWSIAMMRGFPTARPSAAVVRLLDSRRPYAVPFYELFTAESLDASGKIQSVLGWSSYHTTADVTRRESHEAQTPAFDAARARRRSATSRPIFAEQPHAARVRPFEPPRTTPPSVASPVVEQKPAEPASAVPPPPEQSIDRIFDQPAAPSRRTPTLTAPRRDLFRLFSFRPRLGGRALAVLAIALAILVAWYARH